MLRPVSGLIRLNGETRTGNPLTGISEIQQGFGHACMLCRFWDWKSGNRFQEGQTIVQPGSLESEAGIYAASFDMSGSRLLTAEADKTIKFWREDQSATQETHPVIFRPPKDIRRY